MPHATASRWTPQEREAIAAYLREAATDLHLLLHLSDATMCDDIAAILRGAALRLEHHRSPASQVATPLYTSIPIAASL